MTRLPSQYLADLSRDRRFLIRTSLSIVVMSTVLSFILAAFVPRKLGELLGQVPKQDLKAIHQAPSRSDPQSLSDWVFWIRFNYPVSYPATSLDFRNLLSAEHGSIPKNGNSPFEKHPLLKSFYEGVQSNDRHEFIEQLESTSESLRYRNEFLGDLYILDKDYAAATNFYSREAQQFPESSYAQRSAVMAALRNNDPALARLLLSQSEIADRFTDYDLMNLQADARAWIPLLESTFKYEKAQLLSFFVIPAVFTGLIWYLILTNFWRFDRTRLIASLFAVALGVLSANLTLYAVMLQERAFGFTHAPSSSQLSQAIYFIAGVGLREETIKLVCFIPIAIWCARRKNDLEALILAALVGLGFAAMENISYFRTGLIQQSGLTRLLTANPLHFTLTGLVGFYGYRMIVRKFYGMEEFLATFILAVLFHGAYDAVIMIPEWSDWSILTFILMALLVYRYFDPLRGLMDIQQQRKRLSPLGIFIMGSVAIACIVMMVSAPFLGFHYALAGFAEAVGSILPLAFAYISRFRDL
jgi:RsiW-degrading membrane proteinase PrsW (M82 family)